MEMKEFWQDIWTLSIAISVLLNFPHDLSDSERDATLGEHDKHIEVIVRQMFSKMRVLNNRDTDLVQGDVIDKSRLQEINEQLEKDGRELVTAEQLLMGITKISLSTESFLAAASFQETTRVLIEAAVTGKTDYLKGLKENVIIGKLIPAGTGFNPDVAKENQRTAELPI